MFTWVALRVGVLTFERLDHFLNTFVDRFVPPIRPSCNSQHRMHSHPNNIFKRVQFPIKAVTQERSAGCDLGTIKSGTSKVVWMRHATAYFGLFFFVAFFL